MKAVSLRFPQSGVVLVAVVFIAMFFFTTLPRLLYPYDLDFIEDSMLMQSLRIAEGQPVYIPPNADFNPHVYMPLFPWLGGMLFRIGGPSVGMVGEAFALSWYQAIYRAYLVAWLRPPLRPQMFKVLEACYTLPIIRDLSR